MSETDWSTLREPHQRLQWARRYWQNKQGGAPTARAAAESLGMLEDTYTAYERAPTGSKQSKITHQRAIQFGEKFKVNWVWILTGEETPFQRTPAQVRAVELMAQAEAEEQERVVEIISAALRRRAS